MTTPTLFVAVVGAAGYSGAELVAMLAAHPEVSVVGVYGSGSRGGDEALSSVHPRLRGVADLPIEAGEPAVIIASGAKVVFLCTPHEASEDLAPALLEAGLIVFDLSASFRLRDPALYPAHYGFEHRHPELLATAVYGLAELRHGELSGAQLIAVPGCYPTSVILPVRPLVDAGLVLSGRVIVDSSSGVSGAGRTAAVKSLFCEVSMQPYGVLSHRHQPEMAQETGADVLFTPHLGCWDRGILSTIHADLAPGATVHACRQALADRYEASAFVRVMPEGSWPSVAGVERTNFCDIGVGGCDRRGHLVITSAIDNLVKGAAGQALQCMNLRFGFPESMGLGLSRHAAASTDAGALA
ncbi:MAG: N-acetyl-gamma-glutamyl-phosphate reductase [Planctomycetes bacterium]|nr:N-acetyl-gamma-glutamyl-phosphate reductase [Planctomycetota bacterium]